MHYHWTMQGNPNAQHELPYPTFELVSAALISVASTLLFFLIHPEILQGFSTSLLGTALGDGGLYVWLTQSFMSDPANALRFETNGMFPYPLTRAWSDSYLLPAGAALALTKAGLSFTAAYNAVLVVALGLNGGATYLLARRLGLSGVFAAVFGCVFANSSYLIGNIGHPQLLFFFWVPLAWSLVLPSRDERRAAARMWLLAGLCVGGAFYCAVYYAIFAALGLAILWCDEFIRGASSLRRSQRTLLLAAVGALPIAYALPSYLAVQGYFGARGLYEAEAFAASGLSYLAFSSMHALYGASSRLSHGEAFLGAGYLVLALALIYGVLGAVRIAPIVGGVLIVAIAALGFASSIVDMTNTSEMAISMSAWVVLCAAILFRRKVPGSWGTFLLISAVFFVFSFGPGGNPVKGEPSFAPLGILYERLPGVSAIRAVGRFGIVVVLAVIVGAARVVQGWAHKRTRVVQVLSALAFAGVGITENLVAGIPFMPLPGFPLAIQEFLRNPARTGAAVMLPFGGSADDAGVRRMSEQANVNTQYALWSSAAGAVFPVVNGYSGQRTKIQKEIADISENFPDAESLDYFARICGLETVLVLPTMISTWNTERFEESLVQWQESISKVTRASDGSLALELAEREQIVSADRPVSFVAPRNSVARLKVSVAVSVNCSVTVESLGKRRDGEVESIHSDTYLVSGQQDVRIIPPPKLSKASPHVVRVRAEPGCEARVVCGY